MTSAAPLTVAQKRARLQHERLLADIAEFGDAEEREMVLAISGAPGPRPKRHLSELRRLADLGAREVPPPPKIVRSPLPPRPWKRSVYYLLDPERDRIKIGLSNRPTERMKAFHIPGLVLLACEPGSHWVEGFRHRQFSRFALGREWFVYSQELKAHIQQIRQASE